MGRGDKRSGKGKRTIGSYGKTRVRKGKKTRPAKKRPDLASAHKAFLPLG